MLVNKRGYEMVSKIIAMVLALFVLLFVIYGVGVGMDSGSGKISGLMDKVLAMLSFGDSYNDTGDLRDKSDGASVEVEPATGEETGYVKEFEGGVNSDALDIGDKMNFNVLRKVDEERILESHTLILKSIDENRIVIIIQSDYIEVEISLGETIQIDVNDDGILDLELEFVSIENGKPVLNKRLINQVNNYHNLGIRQISKVKTNSENEYFSETGYIQKLIEEKQKVNQEFLERSFGSSSITQYYEEDYSKEYEELSSKEPEKVFNEKPHFSDGVGSLESYKNVEWLYNLPWRRNYEPYDLSNSGGLEVYKKGDAGWTSDEKGYGVSCGPNAMYDALGQLGYKVEVRDLINFKQGGFLRNFMGIFSHDAKHITFPDELVEMGEYSGFSVQVLNGKEATLENAIKFSSEDSVVIARRSTTSRKGLFEQHYSILNTNLIKYNPSTAWGGADREKDPRPIYQLFVIKRNPGLPLRATPISPEPLTSEEIYKFERSRENAWSNKERVINFEL